MTDTLLISVEGLHCINCVNKVEKLLQSCPGVDSASVNLTKKQARLSVQKETFDLAQSLDKMTESGFSGRLLSERQTQQQNQENAEQKALLLKMGVAGCVAANVMLLSLALYVGQFQGIESGFKSFFQLVGFLLATPVVFYCGRHFAEPAWKSLRQGHITIDVPITVGLGATYLLSVVSFARGSDEQYFDTVTAFLFALLVGRYLQSIGMSRVRSSLDLLLGLRPERTHIVLDGQLVEIPVEELKIGHIVNLAQGSSVPADGSLVSGRVEVDESAMSGEALPVTKNLHDPLLAGTQVFSGACTMRVDAVGAKTTLSRLGQLIEETQESRMGEGRLSGKIAAIFSVAILFIALVVFLCWLPAGLEKATLTSVSVLVITCPCALGLALPLAYWMAVRTGAEQGVLVKDEAALELTPKLSHLILDKTGTLTLGRPELSEERFLGDESAQSVGPIVEFLERESPHPFARVLAARFADYQNPDQGSPCCVKTVPGRGRQATLDGKVYFLGNKGSSQSDIGCDIELTRDGEALAGWRFDDALRPEAKELIAGLKKRGFQLTLLSGDREDRTQRVADELGIEQRAGGQLPADKAEWVSKLKAEGATVGLLGDGINDGPALAKADVGVAMGHASAVATASAPVLLLRPGLAPVLAWLNLGKAYRSTVKSSLILSALYNLSAVPLAACGLVSPLVAAIAMPLASLTVVVNSLRLPRRL